MNIELLDSLTSLSEQINAIAYSLPNLKNKHKEIFFVELINKSDQLISQLKNTAPTDNLKHLNSGPTHLAKTETTPQNSFASRLRLALAHSGMTQGVLADWTGVSQGAISSYVTGRVKEAGITRARLMAQALRVRALWLIYGEGEMLLAPNF